MEYIRAGGPVHFVLNYDNFPFPGLVRFYLLHPMILIMPIK